MPFAVRLVTIPPNSFSVQLDDELDGFEDDPVIAGEYCQTGGVAIVGIQAWTFDTLVEPFEVALDNVRIRILSLFVDGVRVRRYHGLDRERRGGALRTPPGSGRRPPPS